MTCGESQVMPSMRIVPVGSAEQRSAPYRHWPTWRNFGFGWGSAQASVFDSMLSY